MPNSKRILDLTISLPLLALASPFLVLCLFLIYSYDRSNPVYVANRVGKQGRPFKMYKLRSMIVNAESSGPDSTSSADSRITPIGKIVRRLKLDELTQLINVLTGDMSLVGPRPNVRSETDLYSDVELQLLSVKPGITDFSSIVFSDEGAILSEAGYDADLAYNQLIRPYKSRLGLFYIANSSLSLDLFLIFTTALSFFSREMALTLLASKLTQLHAPSSLVTVSRRLDVLVPSPPPGFSQIIQQR